MVERVCRKCHFISEENVCPNCKSTDLSDDFGGLITIIDPEKSIIAKTLKINRKGRYAIRVR
ncbi:MAG: transcription elongation factor subunit Spt4 [Candidatus Bathyarchaeia archaeon]